MLEAVIRLREQGRRVRYVIVGDGEERHRLETMAVDIGASPFVNFVGVVPADELPTYYAAADIFCHPNRVDGHDVEGFGIVFLEAAAARLPVVGGDSGGVPEAVDRDITGLLVSGTDAGELTSALRTLVDDPALRKLMGDAGSARVSAHFSWDRAAAIVRRAHERIAGVA
jgi:phosphatidylinositol alpha-1,6-mannosyltransferase